MIDDADDARIRWHLDREEGESRFLAPNEEDRLGWARADSIDSDERPAGGRAIRRERLQQHQLDPVQLFVLHPDDDIADDKRFREARKRVREAEKALREARKLERQAAREARERKRM